MTHPSRPAVTSCRVSTSARYRCAGISPVISVPLSSSVDCRTWRATCRTWRTDERQSPLRPDGCGQLTEQGHGPIVAVIELVPDGLPGILQSHEFVTLTLPAVDLGQHLRHVDTCTRLAAPTLSLPRPWCVEVQAQRVAVTGGELCAQGRADVIPDSGRHAVTVGGMHASEQVDVGYGSPVLASLAQPVHLSVSGHAHAAQLHWRVSHGSHTLRRLVRHGLP